MIPTASPPGAGGSGGALAALRRRDDLLSLLYWLHADGLNDTPSAADLALFAGAADSLAADLNALVRAGLAAVEPAEGPGADGGPRVRLTRAGLGEGRRRFEEEFAPVPPDGTAGNAHEVMVGICGPNAKCVKDGTHGGCEEPGLPAGPGGDA